MTARHTLKFIDHTVVGRTYLLSLRYDQPALETWRKLSQDVYLTGNPQITFFKVDDIRP